MQLIQLLVIQYNAHNDINSYYVDGVSIILVGLPVNVSGH